METFIYSVRAEPSGQETFRTLKAPFGDGYTQVAKDGINTTEESWNCTARGMWQDPNLGVACGTVGQDVWQIAAFLRENASKAFIWTAPDGVTAFWRCDGFAKSREGKLMLLNFTFYRTYFP